VKVENKSDVQWELGWSESEVQRALGGAGVELGGAGATCNRSRVDERRRRVDERSETVDVQKEVGGARRVTCTGVRCSESGV
jgi:hypothetical protein